MRYNAQNNSKIDPTLNELIYVIIRLSDSIRQDRSVDGWATLVREVKRRLYARLNAGSGFQQANDDLP